MALTGISRTDTFEYVSNDDPCKRRVQKIVEQNQPSDDPNAEPLPAIIVPGEFTTVIDEGATKFKLGVLDVFLMGMIYDKATKITRSLSVEEGVSMQTNVNATNIDTVRFGLHGWEHFIDQTTGSDMKFESEKRIVMGRDYVVATDKMLGLLGLRLIGELAEQIKEASEVQKDEAKNSVTA